MKKFFNIKKFNTSCSVIECKEEFATHSAVVDGRAANWKICDNISAKIREAVLPHKLNFWNLKEI